MGTAAVVKPGAVGRVVLSSLSFSVVSDSFADPRAVQPARRLCPRGFPGKQTGLGRCFLLQGVFPTKGLNSHRLH